MADSADCIDIRGLHVALGGVPVLKGLDLRVHCGQRIFVTGGNGAGKTTLLRAVLGLVRRSDGVLSVLGRDVGSREWMRSRRLAGYVSQDSVRTDFPYAAEEVVEVGLAALFFNRRERRERVEAAMRTAGCLALRGRMYARLSGGERQKVSLARCLCQEPRLLLLDEPTSALDAGSRAEILRTLRELSDGGVTVLAVTHDAAAAGEPGWKVAMLENGLVREAAP